MEDSGWQLFRVSESPCPAMRHSGAGRNPERLLWNTDQERQGFWIPAFAGMTGLAGKVIPWTLDSFSGSSAEGKEELRAAAGATPTSSTVRTAGAHGRAPLQVLHIKGKSPPTPTTALRPSLPLPPGRPASSTLSWSRPAGGRRRCRSRSPRRAIMFSRPTTPA